MISTCTWPLGYKLLGHAQCIQVHLRQPNNKYPFTSTFCLNCSRQEATNRTPPLAAWLLTENLPARKFFNLRQSRG